MVNPLEHGELPKVRLCSAVVWAWTNADSAEFERSKTALKTGLGSGWSVTAAFQFMSGQHAKAVLEYGLPEEQLPMLTAHLIAKEVCAEYGLGAVNKPDQVDRAQLLTLIGARQNRIQ